MTRREVADRAGLTTGAVAAAERRGELDARRDAKGNAVYADDAVAAWLASRAPRRAQSAAPLRRARDPGRIAARVFQLLDEGAEVREVVRRARIDPTEAQRLYAAWSTPFAVRAKLEAERAEREADARRSDQTRRQMEAMAKMAGAGRR